jgi:hypothetical protein
VSSEPHIFLAGKLEFLNLYDSIILKEILRKYDKRAWIAHDRDKLRTILIMIVNSAS